MEMVEEEI